MAMTYSQQLKHPNWQKKRLEILERDHWKCVECSDKETTLHVHHKRYIKGHMAWEYEDSNFETLCETCHEQAHLSKDALNQVLAQVPSCKVDQLTDLLIGFCSLWSEEVSPNDHSTAMVGALANFMCSALSIGEIEILGNSLYERLPFEGDFTITLPKRNRPDL